MNGSNRDRQVLREPGVVGKAHRDIVAGGIMTAALILFVGTGGSVVTDFLSAVRGTGVGADGVMTSALLLNIALILFGWRRYAELRLEVNERFAAEQRAQHLALTDPLTGLLNRRALGEAAAELAARSAKRAKTVAFLMLDLDQFKKINDLYGHEPGDVVLKTVAERMGRALPPSAQMARLGGDEFACVMAFDPEHPGTVDRIAEDLIEQIARPIDHDGIQLLVTTSIGLSRLDFDCDSIDMLMRQADIAMYAAKKGGRNRFAWFDKSMEMELRERNTLESAMRRGIPLGEFVPYYEQQVDLTTGQLIGFEMLARWESPSQGFIAPDAFIPIAEETGLIGDLSMSIMRQAFMEAKNWDPGLSLSVNISPVQLLDPWLAQKLVKLLVETGFPATRLEIEITETSLFDNLALAQSIIGSLKNQGIRIALDDFGTGYSSLAHLRALPFDRIKIDRSFISSINQNSESAAIVKAIASLGESLGLPITAEGIEDKEIEDRLKTMGNFKGQGWYFGKPLSTAGARRLLAERNLLPGQRVDQSAADTAMSPEIAIEPIGVAHSVRKAG